MNFLSLVTIFLLNIYIGLLVAKAGPQLNIDVVGKVSASSISTVSPIVIQTPQVDLTEIKKLIKEQNNGEWDKYLIATLSAMVGVVIAGIINWRLQRQRLVYEKEKATKEISVEATKELNGLRLRQFGELYGPLKALLGQSKGVHYQLCLQLVQFDPKKFRLQDDPQSTLGQTCEVCFQGSWKPFRLLYEIQELYESGCKIDPLVTQIINISKGIVKIIHEKAGLALAGQNEIHDVFARYLSHIAVLEDAYQTARNATGKKRLGVREYSYGAYPRELNKLVDDGFYKISQELEGWEALMNDLSTGNSSK